MKLQSGGQEDTGETLVELDGNGDELMQETRLCLRINLVEIDEFRFEHLRVNRMECILR